MTARKSWGQRLDEQPTRKWMAITGAIVSVVTFLGTVQGQKVAEIFRPQTAMRLGQIDTRLTLIERDLDGLTRAMWRAGISTNRMEVTR